MKTRVKIESTDWRETNIGWRGFFQGYATAEKDAISRSKDRVASIIANVKVMVQAGKSEAELMEFLNRIEVRHG